MSKSALKPVARTNSVVIAKQRSKKPQRRSRSQASASSRGSRRHYRLPVQGSNRKARSKVQKKIRRKLNRVEGRIEHTLKTMRSYPSATQAVVNIARAYALPLESSPVRLKNQFANRPTAVAHPKYITPLDFTTGSGAGINHAWALPAGVTFAAVSRNPLQHIVEYDHNTANLLWRANAYFGASAAPNPTVAYQTIGPQYAWYDRGGEERVERTTALPLAYVRYLNDATYTAPGGNVHTFAGEHQGKMGVWINGNITPAYPSGTQVRATVYSWLDWSSTTTWNINDVVVFQSYKLVAGVWEAADAKEHTFTVTAPDVILDISIIEPAYYAFEIKTLQDNSRVFKLNLEIDGDGPSMVIRPVAGIFDKISTLSDITVHAASIMMSCNASALVANGDVAGIQMATGEQFCQMVTESITDTIAQGAPESIYYGLYKKGCYAFLKTRIGSDLDPVKIFCRMTTSSQDVTGVCCPLLPPSGWLLLAAKCGDPQGATGYLTVCAAIEYTTTDQWVHQRPPEYTTAEFTAAMEMFLAMKQFHENPLHFTDIVNFLKSGARHLYGAAPTLLRMFGAANPMYQSPSAAAAAFIENNPW